MAAVAGTIIFVVIAATNSMEMSPSYEVANHAAT
jgi:hypothetical protein